MMLNELGDRQEWGILWYYCTSVERTFLEMRIGIRIGIVVWIE